MRFPLLDAIVISFYEDFEVAFYCPESDREKFKNYDLVRKWYLAQMIYIQRRKGGWSSEAAESEVRNMGFKKMDRTPKERKKERERIEKAKEKLRKKG